MPSYTTIKGAIDTAQNQSDFDAAVNAVGGAAVCVGGQSISGTVITQAVNADIADAAAAFVAANCPSVTLTAGAGVTRHRTKPKLKVKKRKRK